MTKFRITHSVREKIIGLALENPPVSRFSSEIYNKYLENNKKYPIKLKPETLSLHKVNYKGRTFTVYEEKTKTNDLLLHSVIETTFKPFTTSWRGSELHAVPLDRNLKGTLINKASKDKAPVFFRQRLIPKAKRLFLEKHPILSHLKTKLNFHDARTIKFVKKTYDIIIFTTTNHIYASIFEPIDFQYYYRGKLELDDSFMRQFIKPRRK